MYVYVRESNPLFQQYLESSLMLVKHTSHTNTAGFRQTDTYVLPPYCSSVKTAGISLRRGMRELPQQWCYNDRLPPHILVSGISYWCQVGHQLWQYAPVRGVIMRLQHEVKVKAAGPCPRVSQQYTRCLVLVRCTRESCTLCDDVRDFAEIQIVWR